MAYCTSHIQLGFSLGFKHGVGRRVVGEREESGLGGDNKKQTVGADTSGSVDNDLVSHPSA